MSNSYQYLPVPPRVWSRVQNQCTYTVPNNNYKSIYIPLTKQTTSLAQANIEEKIQYKGNILQYKGNSSQLTKNQKYSQISKGLWSNRTKVYATQSQTYTNPNTTSLARINAVKVPFPNQIVGSPNNISGPFQYGIPNPNHCPGNSIVDGGSLICNAVVDPCTGKVTQNFKTQQCYPTYCSDVPGAVIDLCYNPKLGTYFPRNRYTMPNSGNKWPEGYKGLQSAVKPEAPILTLDSYTLNTVTLSWNYNDNLCIPISSYSIYQNGVKINTVPYTVTSIVIPGLIFEKKYTFYIIAISTTIQSVPSNIVTVYIPNPSSPIIISAIPNSDTIQLNYIDNYLPNNIIEYIITYSIIEPPTIQTTIPTIDTIELNYLDTSYTNEIESYIITYSIIEPPTIQTTIPTIDTIQLNYLNTSYTNEIESYIITYSIIEPPTIQTAIPTTNTIQLNYLDTLFPNNIEEFIITYFVM